MRAPNKRPEDTHLAALQASLAITKHPDNIVTGIKIHYKRGNDRVWFAKGNDMEAAAEQLDRALLSYIDAARPAQVRLQQVLTQIAGYSLSLMTSKKRSMHPEGALVSARAALKEVREQLAALKPPSAAAHHYHHLKSARDATRIAFGQAMICTRADATEGERQTLVQALHAANEHVRMTARLLPGFETIDFSQACCAFHAQAADNAIST